MLRNSSLCRHWILSRCGIHRFHHRESFIHTWPVSSEVSSPTICRTLQLLFCLLLGPYMLNLKAMTTAASSCMTGTVRHKRASVTIRTALSHRIQSWFGSTPQVWWSSVAMEQRMPNWRPSEQWLIVIQFSSSDRFRFRFILPCVMHINIRWGRDDMMIDCSSGDGPWRSLIGSDDSASWTVLHGWSTSHSYVA